MPTESERRVIEAAKIWANDPHRNSLADDELLNAVHALEAEPKNPDTVMVELPREVVEAAAANLNILGCMATLRQACRRALRDPANPPPKVGKSAVAPDGEGPYREGDTYEDIGIELRGPWDGKNPDPLTAWEIEIANAAFTAGQQHRSDGGEVAAAKSHDYPLISAEALARRFHETYERRAPDFGYKTREESAVPWAEILDALTPASRREGQPRRWVAKHTDQHVVRHEPFKPGMNFVVQSREAAEGLAQILNAQPPSADLVAAARKLPAMFERATAEPEFEDPRTFTAYVATQAAIISDEIAAALQNTPQPDESEAVKLLRELAVLGRTAFPDKTGVTPAQQDDASCELIRRLYEIPLPEIKTVNTPEVDDAE